MTPRRPSASRLLPLLAFVVGCGEAPSDGRLLVTSGFTDQVFVLDAVSGAVLDSVSLDRRPGEGDEPHGIAVDADGRHWYATLAHGEPTVWKYETAGLRLVGRLTLPTRGASRIRISPDGETAAVPDYWRSGGGDAGRVAVLSTHDLRMLASPEVCAAPHDAVFSPSGDRLAVTCSQGEGVVILDGETFAVIARHRLIRDGGHHPPDAARTQGSAPRPMNAAWSADGRHLYVSLMGRSAVADLDPVGGSWTEIGVGAGPAQVAVSPDGASLAAANRSAASLSLLPIPAGEPRTVPIPGAHPHGVVFSADGGVVFVTYEGDVTTPGGVVAVDSSTGAVLWHTPLGVFTLGIAYLPS